MRLDGDPALALEVHRVEHLGLHLARLQRAGELEEAIGERRLAVIDVRDDREVADEAGSMLSAFMCRACRATPANPLDLSGFERHVALRILRPVYSARGPDQPVVRAYCSSTCAVQPEIRLTAKIGVNSSIGMPSAW